MYYKRKSKTNWPVVITIGVATFFLIVILSILLVGYLNAKNKDKDNAKIQASNAIPKVELTLNTEEANQEKVYIKVKISTVDSAGLSRIIIPGSDEITIQEENRTEYEDIFEANKNGKYEVQSYGKNGVFGNSTINISNIRAITANDPYIPKGFTKIAGTKVSTGLVIKDQYDNEYTWIPVSGGQLHKNRSDTDPKYYEDSQEYSEFITSVAENQGFYIARYEASVTKINNKDVAISQPNYTPVSRITYKLAEELSKNVAIEYKYEDVKTAIISSGAWDTVLEWISKSYSGYKTSTSYGNYTNVLRKSGETQSDKLNNIYDLSGNVREWTSENYRLSDDEKRQVAQQGEDRDTIPDYKIVRSGNVSNKTNPNTSVSGNPLGTYANTGFRFVLYR